MKNCKAAAIMDRCESYNGNGGPLGSEVTAGLYRSKVMIETVNYIYGLLAEILPSMRFTMYFPSWRIWWKTERKQNSISISDYGKQRRTVSNYSLKEMMNKRSVLPRAIECAPDAEPPLRCAPCCGRWKKRTVL